MVLIWLIKGVFYKFCFYCIYIKISEGADLTYYQKNREVILNRAKDYYENDKERLREQARYLKKKRKKKKQKKRIGK